MRLADGTLTDAATALRDNGIEPVVLAEKEGLALINGTDGMLGMLVLAIHDLRHLLKVADVSAAMSVEGLLGTDDVFAADLHALRPQLGQGASAANILAVMAGSPIRESHRTEECTRVQDAYSLRCAPQVHGGARDTVEHAARVAAAELASAVDNPVVTPDGRVESNGNFHGAPVAYVLDFLAIVAADVASMAERRTDRFLDQARNHGLPALPRRRPRRRLRPDDRAVHAGRDRLGDEAARRTRVGRLDPELGHAGGPRLDGLVGRPQAAPLGRRARPRARHRGADGGPRHPSCGRRSSRPPATAAVIAALGARERRVPARTGSSPPRSRGPARLVADGDVLAAAESVTGPLR